MNITACLSHKTDNWKTPTPIYEAFINSGYIDCFKYMADYDELENNYYKEKLFINPPFSKMEKIADWIIDQSKNNTIALLIPARTDTKYFHKLITLRPTIYFIKGRLHYNDSKSAPFPTILMIFGIVNWFPIYRALTQEQLIKEIKTWKQQAL